MKAKKLAPKIVTMVVGNLRSYGYDVGISANKQQITISDDEGQTFVDIRIVDYDDRREPLFELLTAVVRNCGLNIEDIQTCVEDTLAQMIIDGKN